jgi:hypothetical protein
MGRVTVLEKAGLCGFEFPGELVIFKRAVEQLAGFSLLTNEGIVSFSQVEKYYDDLFSRRRRDAYGQF